MGVTYEEDIAQWAEEQATLIRAGRFSEIDIEHVADEIKSVGRTEARELGNLLTAVLVELLKWQQQSAYRCVHWQRVIDGKREDLEDILTETPSLNAKLQDAQWFDLIWDRSVTRVVTETGLEVFPDTCPWSMEQIRLSGFYPGELRVRKYE